MIDKFVFDVFLSYSSIDKNKIYPLAQRLKKDGLHVWLDEWEISPGDMIGLKIQQGLENSRTLLLCMTPAYFNSEWSKLEHYSLIYRDPANSKRRFIPILIADCEVPNIIAQFAYIDLRIFSEEAYSKIITACRRVGNKLDTDDLGDEEFDQAKSVLEGHDDTVFGIAITPDGSKVLSDSNDWNYLMKLREKG